MCHRSEGSDSIPNYPFHYAKWLYGSDADVEFVTVAPEMFADPLADVGNRPFDAIILTTVFEHLHDPLFVASYLLDRLAPGGLLAFDYVLGEGHGLDHPKAVDLRRRTLAKVLEETDVIRGDIDDLEKSVGFCIARKRRAKEDRRAAGGSVTPRE